MARFVLFTSTYAPEPIGSAVYLQEFAQELVRRGHPTTVVCCYPHYPDWDRSQRRWRYTTIMEHGVRVMRVPHTVPARASALGRLGIEATYGLASAGALVRLGAFDAAIGSVPALAGGLAAWFAGTVRRRPYGVMVRDLTSAAALYGQVPGSGPRVARGVRAVESFILPRAARVSVIARGFEDPVHDLGAKHVDFIPNYRTVAEPSLTREAARERFGIPEGAFSAIYAGAIGFKQGIESLIEAARTAPRAYFLVVGEGSRRRAFEEAIVVSGLSNIRWEPLVPDEEYAELLQAADAFLMPQGETGIDMSVPGKLTSYLSIARPIVVAASGHSETARIVREAGAGVVVAPLDGHAMGQAINGLIDDPATAVAFAESSRRYAGRHLDRSVGLDRFVEWALALAEQREPALTDSDSDDDRRTDVSQGVEPR